MDFTQISLLLVVAALCGLIAKMLKQPVLVGYLFAGFILTAFGILPHSTDLESLGQIGVSLLLFLVGLEMNFNDLRSIGRTATLIGVGQIIFTTAVGFGIATLLGFSTIPALYISIALTFSSTIIIIKLLSEKNDLDSLYGKIAIGVLLIQDIVAMLILVFLSGVSEGNVSIASFVLLFVKAIILFSVIAVLSRKVIPVFFEKYVANSSELLFVVSIAWALGIATLVAKPLGFTYEVGGFLAGLALSHMHEHAQIASKTRPLRDFFLTLFFLFLGTKLVIGGIGLVAGPAILLSIFVLIGNPLIVLILMGLMGHKKRTSFFASVTVAQISEFSFILMAMGAAIGHVTQSHVAIVVLVGVITMTASTYMILQAEVLFEKLSPLLGFFERRKKIDFNDFGGKVIGDHIVLIGGGRTGKSLMKFFKRQNIDYLVVDFSPEVIASFVKQNVNSLFGDIADPEIFAYANVDKAKLLISTTASFPDNVNILRSVKRLSHRPIVILEASTIEEAQALYKLGATYVVLPTHITGEHIRNLLTIYGFGPVRIKKLGKRHTAKLKLALA